MKLAKGLCTTSLLLTASAAQFIDVEVPRNCFAASAKTIGIPTSNGTSFSHKDKLLSGVYTADMRIGRVRGCRDSSNRFAGIQFTLKDFASG